MVYGIIQLINFAHGEVVMIGAMVAFTVINALAPSGLPPLAIVLIGGGCAGAGCMLVGYAMGRLPHPPPPPPPPVSPPLTPPRAPLIPPPPPPLILGPHTLGFFP